MGDRVGHRVATIGTSRRRAGRNVRKHMRREVRGALRRNTTLLLRVVALYALAAAILVGTSVVFDSPSWQLPFTIGALVGFLPCLWLAFSSAMGFAPRWLGADAERWTADELRRLPSRSWAVFHDVMLDDFNVDHVAIGSGRLYAIETKWTSSELAHAHIKRLAGQAAHRANALRRALASRGVRRQVVPLLVLWGPAAHKRYGDQPGMIGETRIVAGSASKDWLKRMQSAAANGAIDYPARQAVRELIVEADAAV